MYCIKCGKNSQSANVLCEDCRPGSGFGEVKSEQLEKKSTYGMYLSVLGNILILIGLLSSFILLKTDAPTDYVAQIFKTQTMGPVESEEAEETESSEEESTEETETPMEAKGYSFGVVEYISRRTPDNESEDINILYQVKTSMDAAKVEALDLSDNTIVETVLGSYDPAYKTKVLEKLDYYDGVKASGVVISVIGIAGLAAAVWLAMRKSFKWSVLCSFIGTLPVWSLFVKLDGITAWEFQSGMYFFVGGLFAVLFGAIMGGNNDICPDCKTTLPGGAVYCVKCGQDMMKKKEKKNLIYSFLKQYSVIIATVGNIIMFLPIIIPAFVVENGEKKTHLSIMGLRGIETVADKGLTGVVMAALFAGLLLLIGAVVTSIFEKHIFSIGVSLLACGSMVLAVFLVQKTVDLAALFTVAFIPVGLLVAIAAGLNAPHLLEEKEETVQEE